VEGEWARVGGRAILTVKSCTGVLPWLAARGEAAWKTDPKKEKTEGGCNIGVGDDLGGARRSRLHEDRPRAA